MVLRQLMRTLGPSPKEVRNLTREEAFRAFSAILAGSESEILIGAFLISLRWKGVTVEELMGFAQAARSQARIPCQGMPGVVALCPHHDGHDHYPPLDVCSGLISAAAGARVLILSDRCVPPRRGLTAASVLESIGLSMTWDPSEAEDWVAKERFAAVSISGMLPPLIALRRMRGDVTVRTPLSTVEKLLAPTTAAVLMGAQGGPVLGTAVEVIQGLEHPRGIVIQGLDGGVTPSVRRRTRGLEVAEGHLIPVTVEPEDFGLGGKEEPALPIYGPPEEGYGTADNAQLVSACGQITMGVLNGETGPARQAALLGAALILKASGRCLTLAEGVDAASKALDSGEALALVPRLQALLH